MRVKPDHYLCRASADLFVLASRRGLDSEKFVDRLFHSEVAFVFYNRDLSTNWLGASYVLDVLEDELHLEQGVALDEDFMYWAGYLYRAWSLLYDDTPQEMVRQAPLPLLEQMFPGLHVMSCELAIEDLKEMYREQGTK